jgi:cytochrome c oxidase subunit II
MRLPRLVILGFFLASGLVPALRGAGAPANPKEIAITVKRFEYSPKEVRLKQGETVTLVLTSQDVTHGLFCRKLKIDADIPPNQETRLTVTPQAAGSYTAICNHFCGAGHGNMKMTFVVE